MFGYYYIQVCGVVVFVPFVYHLCWKSEGCGCSSLCPAKDGVGFFYGIALNPTCVLAAAFLS